VPHVASAPDHDSAETIPPAADDAAQPRGELEAITGLNLVIHYRDAKGAQSERQVICRALERHAGGDMLKAWCSLRGQVRLFRVDRIDRAIDPATGEMFEPAATLLHGYALDLVSASPFRFGLSPRQFADFHAALAVLAFVARSDGDWHPLEEAAIERFATAFWLRFELNTDLDLQAVDHHIRRLSPDAETMWLALRRCAGNPRLARLVGHYLAELIDADGILHPSEVWWASEIATTLREGP
jgi:uncharacterized tellurite resistance protein B-like protein